jgi:pimeloyl-ACP methyl ester carboxylesterase
VIAPDLPGHGESDPPAGDYSLGAHACAMRDLLLSWFSLAGHSLGGGIALQTVFPERVDRLILIGSGGLGSEVSLVLRAGTGAGRGLPSRCCRFINGLLILVTAARPGTGRATSSAKTRVRRSERSSNGRPGSYGCCIYGAVTPTACGRRLPRFSRSTAIADPVDHLGSGYRDGQTHRHHRAGSTGLFLRLALTLAARQKRNANGLLRQYFPKGTSLSRYTPEHLTTVQDEINKRPRRVLGDRSPTELFTALLASQDHQLLRR